MAKNGEGQPGWATAADVAARAGVSRSAVSRTFTPGASVSKATRERVLKAAEELGYQVNRLARSVIQRQSTLVGVVVPGMHNEFVVQLLGPIMRNLARHSLAPLLMDVRDPEQVKAVAQTAIDRFGRIDALVNSAGHGPKGDLLALTDEQWATGMEMYFMNVVRATRLVTPHLLQAGGGAIVNISSFAAVEPDPVFPTSAVFRAGLAAYTKLYADQYAKDGIRMNNVLPGFIDSLPEKAERRAAIPAGRYGHADEVASLIAWLASAEGAYMTGQNLRVDGGLTRSL